MSEHKSGNWILDNLFGIVMLIVIIWGILSFASLTNRKEIIITSTIKEIEQSLDNDMIVHFSNGETYRIRYPEESSLLLLFFHENDTITMKLRYDNYLWIGNPNNAWDILNVISR